MKRLAAFHGILLAACAPAEQASLLGVANGTAVLAGSEPQKPIEELRSTVRAEAQRLYGPECGTVVLPDRAFEPIEITGGGHPEYAVLFGRGTCKAWGASAPWQGTGGAVVQFWLASGGPPRLLLEQQTHGFTPEVGALTTARHGGACPGGAGPNICVVRYRWVEQDRALDAVSREFMDGRNGRTAPRMLFDYHRISR